METKQSTQEQKIGDYISDCVNRQSFTLKDMENILALIKEAGYVSPEDCKQCQQKQVESERMLTREAAFDEERLRDEVKYWKDKNYKLGGG